MMLENQIFLGEHAAESECSAAPTATPSRAVQPIGRVNPKGNLRVIPLGGLEEIGPQLTIFEYGQILLCRYGLQFPDEDMPGID